MVARPASLAVVGAADQRRRRDCCEQRLTGTTVDEAQRASWVRTQDRIDRGSTAPRGITAATELPPNAGRRIGDLAVVGDCDGL